MRPHPRTNTTKKNQEPNITHLIIMLTVPLTNIKYSSQYIMKHLNLKTTQITNTELVPTKTNQHHTIQLPIQYIQKIQHLNKNHVLITTPNNKHPHHIIATILFDFKNMNLINNTTFNNTINQQNFPKNIIKISLLTNNFTKLITATILIIINIQNPAPPELLHLPPPTKLF